MRLIVAGLVLFLGIPALASAQEEKIRGKTVKEWTTALRHADARVRYQAVAALYDEGADAVPLVKELAAALKDPQPVIRRAAAQTLANFKEKAVPAVPALVAALKDADPWVRSLAGQALNEVGESATAPLLQLLEDKDATLRFHAIAVSDGLGLKSKEIAKALASAAKDANPAVRRAALLALSKIDTDDPDIFALLGEALRDKEKQVRLSAAWLLAGKGKEATGALAKAADDADLSKRLLALQTLASLGEEIDEKGVLALRKALADPESRIRQTAALSLANLGVKARELGGDKELFQALAKLLTDKDAQLRRTAVHALGQIGADDGDEVKVVANLLKDGDALVRSFAVQALARFAKDIESEELRQTLRNHLVDALRDADRRVQFMSAQALAQQGSLAVEPLIKLVEEGKGTQRLWAATILGELGPAAETALPALQKMLRDTNPATRGIAYAAMQKITAEEK